MHFTLLILLTSFHFHHSHSTLLSQPLNPTTVPSFPVQTGQTCRLDLSDELFGGVQTACTHTLDRNRCCPVLAAWLYAAYARTALDVITNSSISSPATTPMIPDDSQTCVGSLQMSLQSRNIRVSQPNASCDAITCFCGIRLHQIGSLSCPAAFNLTTGNRNATPMAVVRNLEKNCRNSSYAGCTKCVDALHKLNGEGKNVTTTTKSDRMSKMLSRDCQLMGLTWLLARNKTAYIPTVSAILRAIMYSAHQPPHDSVTCSPDQENMPLAVDSLQFDKSLSSSSTAVFSSSCLSRGVSFVMTILPLMVFV